MLPPQGRLRPLSQRTKQSESVHSHNFGDMEKPMTEVCFQTKLLIFKNIKNWTKTVVFEMFQVFQMFHCAF